MRLIGSRAESLIREQLVKFGGIILENEVVYDLLLHNFSEISSVYCLNQVTEQAEDIYTVLINGDHVIEFELSRMDSSINEVKIEPLSEYSRRIKGKSARLTLSVAMDLIDNH